MRRERLLTTVLRWLAVVLILRVLVAIVANYPDYFPPNFDALFLQDREATFVGLYRWAFYIHIIVGPWVLLNGLVLLSTSVRQRYTKLHRMLGRIQVAVLLLGLLPTSVVMARHAFAGWPAGLSFLLLAVATVGCALVGVIHAQRGRYAHHRRWMVRSYVLLCSAVTLRLMSGGIELLTVSYPESAYIIAAWCSWLLPLAGFEIVEAQHRRQTTRVSRPS